MGGYDGYSMSNRARAAYDDGLVPLSKITAATLADAGLPISARAFRALIRGGWITPAEWHHTSKQYNRTHFYDLADVAEQIATTSRVVIEAAIDGRIMDRYALYEYNRQHGLTGPQPLGLPEGDS